MANHSAHVCACSRARLAGIFPPEPGNGCDTACVVEFGFVCEEEPSVCTFSPLPGELVITEIQKDPEAVLDSAGEWFELFNTFTEPLNLIGMEFSDIVGQSFII